MGGEVLLVAVDASKETSSDHALEWAVQNVTKAEDSLILLAVLPSSGAPKPNSKQRHQHLVARYFLCCGTRHYEGSSFDPFDQSKRDVSHQINYVYDHKMQQLCLANNLMQVHCEVKVIIDAHLGSVAAKAKDLKASWVILDRLLKKEADHCIKQLNCNVVLIDHAIPRILKAVNQLAGEKFSEIRIQSKPTERDKLHVVPNIMDYQSATTLSSSDIKRSTFETFSLSLATPAKEYQCKTNPSPIDDSHVLFSLNSENFNEDFEYLETINTSPLHIESRGLNKTSSRNIDELNHKSATSPLQGDAESSIDIFRTKSSDRKHHFEGADKMLNSDRRLTASSSTSMWWGLDSPVQPKMPITRRASMTTNKHESRTSPSYATAGRNSVIRKAVSLPITSLPNPPALCSICKHKAPIFQKAVRKFNYREIGKATDGFSDANFMAEGVYGCSYRGELPDGQVIAVKQHKKLKAVATKEFCMEVETLGCAQHRNLLMLVGYCIDTEWLLIYEFACNGSLDTHLHESNQAMAWRDRMKVAVGTARGLRYLHEDCRVGCIVHQDLRPSNILLTHDFEPMIGDFGLARWQLNAQLAEETHLIGTFGYLAPEYIQTGQFTEKVDVYAFGVILLELLSGFRSMELSRIIGLQSLSEWGSTTLQKKNANELADSRLNNNYAEREVECMMHAAYLCISPHPEQRPRMSQVLKILEGDLTIDVASNYQNTKIFSNRSVESIKHTKGHMEPSQNNKTNLHVDNDS